VTAQAIPRIDPKTSLFCDDFAANAADLPGAGLGWLEARRSAAIEVFARDGMPTRHVETWKYTDLAAALGNDLEPATAFRAGAEAAEEVRDVFSPAGATVVTLVNGFLHLIGGAELSASVDIVDLAQLSVRTPEWVEKHLGLHAANADQALGAASLALMRGGVAIRVQAGAKDLPPLHLNFVNPVRGHGLMSHARVLLLLEEGASLELIETHSGGGEDALLANLGMEIVLGREAQLHHSRLQEESGRALHVTTIGAELAKGAHYSALIANLGERLSRVDMNVKLKEPGAEAILRSVTALDGESHADVTTVMDHLAPHTTSRQLFKSVLGGRSRSVSQGKVTVREGAVKSDSHQLFKALLLGERAEADAKPELEIFADDVVCGHGTAIGALDNDALFYLRSRGITEGEARALLVRAFLEEAIEGFVEGEMHDALWKRIDLVLDSIFGGDA
jgi:Fe-S cluster assembly protein SufD